MDLVGRGLGWKCSYGKIKSQGGPLNFLNFIVGFSYSFQQVGSLLYRRDFSSFSNSPNWIIELTLGENDILIHSAVPQSVVIIVFAHVVRPHFSKSIKTKHISCENNVVHHWRDCGSGRVDHWWHLSFSFCISPRNRQVVPSFGRCEKTPLFINEVNFLARAPLGQKKSNCQQREGIFWNLAFCFSYSWKVNRFDHWWTIGKACQVGILWLEILKRKKNARARKNFH